MHGDQTNDKELAGTISSKPLESDSYKNVTPMVKTCNDLKDTRKIVTPMKNLQ